MPQIKSLTIDIHRLASFGDDSVVAKGQRYIGCTGSHAAAECEMQMGHEDFLRRLNKLRYQGGRQPREIEDALTALGSQAAQLLPHLDPPASSLQPMQIDLVLNAAELWALPFEACIKDGAHVFADPERPLILTRRIRQGFIAHRKEWPVRPRILFIHAPAAGDLPEALIDRHVGALREALEPWAPGASFKGLLDVEFALAEGDIERILRGARDAGAPFTHVHILAHGKAIVDPETNHTRWGLRLGDERREASDPAALAEALRPANGLPVVVTVAACDSGNQAAAWIAKKSFAQELHRQGIPVVLASQLPLTHEGSVTIAGTFYGWVLRGEDVRGALHATRLELRSQPSAGHDWMSLVGYVQLPEGYSDHLVEVGVKCEMALLRAARLRLDACDESLDQSTPDSAVVLDEIATSLVDRIESLELRLASIPPERESLRRECRGVLASAHKRLAEVLFRRSRRARAVGDAAISADLEQSRGHLEAALLHYRDGFREDLRSHWLGAQQLSLEVVLNGRFADPRVWLTSLYAAELALASNESDYWARGSLAELLMLAPFAKQERDLVRAKRLLEELRVCADAAKDAAAVDSTRDQLKRYVNWWRKHGGFFGDEDDLESVALELLPHLDRN